MLETNNAIDFQSITKIDLEDVVLQMEKDIQSAGSGFTFKSREANALIIELSKAIVEIDRLGRLPNLLYRIDVKESNIDQKSNYYEAVSSLCWNRVFQKVWLRKNFKTGNR
jgi:hypothetical protein